MQISDELVEKAAKVAWDHPLPTYVLEENGWVPAPSWDEASGADEEESKAGLRKAMRAAVEAVAGDIRKQVLAEAIDAAIDKYIGGASGPVMNPYNQGVTDARLAILALLEDEDGAGDEDQ